jgi:hypothetical protein
MCQLLNVLYCILHALLPVTNIHKHSVQATPVHHTNLTLACMPPVLCSVKGLPWWYQLLVGLAGLLALGGLWLTFLTDPGALPPSASQGEQALTQDAYMSMLLLVGCSHFVGSSSTSSNIIVETRPFPTFLACDAVTWNT